ncbi:hypothetical protein GCM10010124_33500 [Pilimelia terevasa]|uniref:Uncharacterized protein n=1 Tax=Pilimelia terevasa TaxID=53372 RepID=A0A8J3BSY1_9ACTN|nr:HEAT repeat domain-containing protein [Pilimelia terevasa]GGK37953.1 hypothetical protein GCM10010124_33500 [Pilimelia terevasa]
MTGDLRWVLAGVAAAVVGMTVVIVLVRAARHRRERHRAALTAGPRRELLAFAADGDDPAPLLALPAPVWRELLPTAVRLLGQVRGDARAGLVDLLLRRGLADEALADLRGRGAARRAAAAQTLGDLAVAQPPIVAALSRALRDPDADVRAAAVRALGHVGDPAAVAPLLAALTGRARLPAILVADALSALDAAAEPEIVAAIGHADPLVRMTVLDALRVRRAVTAARAAVAVLDGDPVPDVRRVAATALGVLGGRSAVPPLVEVASSGAAPPLRAAAAVALGELGARAAVPALVRLLADPGYEVASAAAESLARLEPDGVRALRVAAGTDGPGRAYAAQSLALAELRAAR